MDIKNWLITKGIKEKNVDEFIPFLPEEMFDEPFIDFFTPDYIMSYNDENIPIELGYIEVGVTLDGTCIALDTLDPQGAIFYLPTASLEHTDANPRPYAIKVANSAKHLEDLLDEYSENGNEFPSSHWEAISLLDKNEAERISNRIHYGTDHKPTPEEEMEIFLKQKAFFDAESHQGS